jgi:FtsP/CotA-like multicopper oxidase with cupredoxin domain
MVKTPKLFRISVFSLAAIFVMTTGTASASFLVPQTWLQGDSLFNTIAFTQPLTAFGSSSLPRVNAALHPSLTVTMREIEQQVLPQDKGYPKTRVWVYETSDANTSQILGPAHWPAVTIENQRGSATTVNYVNNLPSFNPVNSSGPPFVNGLVQGLLTMDQTIHWADPLGNTGVDKCTGPNLTGVDCTLPANAANACCLPFTGPQPTVVHLHGAEAISFVDGGPDAWFTPDGLFGSAFFTAATPTVAGQSTYVYENKQEPATLWFHDHALGLTRTDILSGLEGFYFIRDATNEPQSLPTGTYEVELLIQDRQFDTNGQLFFPDGTPSVLCGSGTAFDPCLNGPPPNPNIHPFAVPEFFGDVATVNGVPWPVLQVEPRRYLFRILDGSNARMYRLGFPNADPKKKGAPAYIIGGDDNYINKPAPIYDPSKPLDKFGLPFTGFKHNTGVFIAPAERVYVIVDFTGLAGQTITMTNDVPAPFPTGGLIPGALNQQGMAQIMQFKVTAPLQGTDASCNPAAGGCTRPTPIVALADGNGGVASGVHIDKIRQFALKEHEGQGGSGGPVDVFVNNTRYDGTMSPGIDLAKFPGGITELPQVGSVELWEIINLTADAHPIHVHLSQFQIVNRQNFRGNSNKLISGYYDAWGSAFFDSSGNLPFGCVNLTDVFADTQDLQNPCPGYGPPLPYDQVNADGALGGNPALGPYLTGSVVPPTPGESGWKDTVKSYPGMVTRILLRWTPSDVPLASSSAGENHYSFDPSDGPGYFTHCHIVDHEDNDMMRPYKVTK